MTHSIRLGEVGRLPLLDVQVLFADIVVGFFEVRLCHSCQRVGRVGHAHVLFHAGDRAIAIELSDERRICSYWIIAARFGGGLGIRAARTGVRVLLLDATVRLC